MSSEVTKATPWEENIPPQNVCKNVRLQDKNEGGEDDKLINNAKEKYKGVLEAALNWFSNQTHIKRETVEQYSFTYYFGVDKYDPTKLPCFPARITSGKLLDEYSHKAVSTEQPKRRAAKKSGVEKLPLNFLLLVEQVE